MSDNRTTQRNANYHIDKNLLNEEENHTIPPEDNIQAESLMSETNKLPPRPFINNFRGPPPASFHPTRPRPTELTYAQLQHYPISHPRTPHNIQDIIGFIMPKDGTRASAKLYPNSHDPFYYYKPKDPSDINLLATANLRFAPPAWKEIKSKPVQALSSSTKPHEPQINYEQQQTQNTRKTRALTLHLNVFPMANDPHKENFYAVSASNHQSQYPNRNRKFPPMRKMIIHLNLYQNDMASRDFIDEDYENERNLIERNMDVLQDVLNKNILKN